MFIEFPEWRNGIFLTIWHCNLVVHVFEMYGNLLASEFQVLYFIMRVCQFLRERQNKIVEIVLLCKSCGLFEKNFISEAKGVSVRYYLYSVVTF